MFDFRLGRGREGPHLFLGKFEGILQTDGYAAYERVGGPKMVHAVCWAHARRKFFEAYQLSPGDGVAKGVVMLIDQLFAIDAEARGQALPSSKLGNAAKYTLGLWPKLVRFLEYPELELSNNLAENSMRPVASGRNYVLPVIMCSPPVLTAVGVSLSLALSRSSVDTN